MGAVHLLTLFTSCCSVAYCSIISQSSIVDCVWGDKNDPKAQEGGLCAQKLVISMTLKAGQGNTESLYLNVDQVYEKGAKEMSRLKKPFRIEIQKSAVVSSYKAIYVNSTNAKPKEVSSLQKNCKDDWNLHPSQLACGKQRNTMGEYVWDSQGFCCSCGNPRGTTQCSFSDLWNGIGSGHCLQMNELWYDGYTLQSPVMEYNIQISVLTFDGFKSDPTTNTQQPVWTPMTSFTIDPATPLGKSDDGTVVVEIQGDLLGSQSVLDLSNKYLFVPSKATLKKNAALPVQITNGPSDWLLVDSNMVDFSGTQCNMIGTSYTAFRTQPGKCYGKQQACLGSQLLDLWTEDNALRNISKTGHYMAYNFGTIDPSSQPNNNSFILRFTYNDLHNTFLTFNLDASSLSFVKNVGQGKIMSTHATDFEALSGYGTIYVVVSNIGDIAASFSVAVVNCNAGVQQIPAKTIALDPGQTGQLSFVTQAYYEAGNNYNCEAQLYDSDYNLLQTATLSFKTNSTCLCFGTCGCTCESKSGLVTCPTPRPLTVRGGPLVMRMLLLLLDLFGIQGFVFLFGGLLLVLGFVKLFFGRVLFCRKNKSEAFKDSLRQRGEPLGVQCSGECRGAKAARAKFHRKMARLRRMGKKPHDLEDWRNYSYVCSCHEEISDIKCLTVVKSLCFFYYCFFLPFIWLGKKVLRRVLDSRDKMEEAEAQVLEEGRGKGHLEQCAENTDSDSELNEDTTLHDQDTKVTEQSHDQDTKVTKQSHDQDTKVTKQSHDQDTKVTKQSHDQDTTNTEQSN